ncbi:MAG: hypothetical protein IJO22_00105 [Oscillospiraceae bacterium]|nr:hypothetical protein [Oscillospiraceae bacterium]
MPYIERLIQSEENEPHSFRVTFCLGKNSDGSFITRTNIWVAPSELCEEEILQNIQQTAEAYEKVMKSFTDDFKCTNHFF